MERPTESAGTEGGKVDLLTAQEDTHSGPEGGVTGQPPMESGGGSWGKEEMISCSFEE